jgi:hypothetical protein
MVVKASIYIYMRLIYYTVVFVKTFAEYLLEAKNIKPK